MPSLGDLFASVLVPALVCGTLLALIWASRTSTAGESLARRHLAALAVAAGVLAGYHAIAGLPVLPSASRRLAAIQWMPWLVIAALVVSLAQTQPAVRRIPAWIFGAIVCVLVVALSFLGQIAAREKWLAFAQMAAVLFLAWRSLDALARREPGPAIPVVLWVVVTATSVAALVSHSAKIAQLSGALAACLGACIVVALWNRFLSAAGGVVAIAMTVLGVAWLNAVHFSDLAPGAALCLIAAAFTPWLARTKRVQAWSRTKRVLAYAFLAAVPAAAGVVVAQLSTPSYEY